MKYERLDDQLERLDDLAQTQEAMLENESRDAERCRKYSVQIEHSKDTDCDVDLDTR
jgi:hypothetical protein